MPTKLKGLKIKRVALVDEGANPDAYIKFAKSKDGQPEPMDDAGMTSEEAIGIFDRFAGFIRKMLGGEKVSKTAFTFAQTEEKRNYDKVMTEEIYPTIWAFTDSVCSILNDTEKTDDEKASLLKQSVTEFSDTFSSCAGAWSQAQSAQSNVVKDDAVLTKMRDSIAALIEKKADSGEEQPEDEGEDDDGSEDSDDDEDKGGKETPPVKKGATEMEFDTSKMTPEEKAQFDDLAKRFGKPEQNPAPAPAANPQPAENPAPAGDDVNKGLTPELKAEIEALRKFRQDAEEKELAEVAKHYEIIGKKPDELVPVLKSLKAAGKEAYDQFIAGLDGAVKAVEKSGMFSEVGKRGAPSTSGDDAWGKIEAAAHEIQKARPEMRWPDAVDAACSVHPDLVEQYEKSRA